MYSKFTDNPLAYILIALLVLYGAVFGYLAHLDRVNGDIDYDPITVFPVHGQDSPGFARLADNLGTYHAFTLDGTTPETFRTPGYPFFVYVTKHLGGLTATIFFQILASFCSVVLVYLIAKKLYGDHVAVIGALVFGISPSFIFHTTVILSEAPFIACFLFAVYLLFFIRHKSNWSYFFAGIVLALSAYIRPITLFLPILLVPFLIWRLRRDYAWKKIIFSAFLFVFGFLLVLAPWFVRNYIKTNVLGFSSLSAYNIAAHNVPDFLLYQYGADSSEVKEYDKNFRVLTVEQASSLAYGDEVAQIFMPVLKSNFVSYVKFHLLGTTKFFLSSSIRSTALFVNSPRLHNLLGLTSDSPDMLSLLVRADFGGIGRTLSTQTLITLDRLLMIVIVLLALGSLLIRTNRYYAILFWAFILYFALLTGPVSIPRYRLPVEPFMVMLAVWGFADLVGHVRRYLYLQKG